jgi:hypothetical protein
VKLINRRYEARFDTDGIAEMRIGLPGSGKIIDVRVCDLSRSGIRIQADRQLSLNSEVMIQLSDILISAEVRRCGQIASNLYDVGLKILDVREMPKPVPQGCEVSDSQAA